MKHHNRIPGPTERRVGYVILALLALIGTSHFLARFHVDPDVQILEEPLAPGTQRNASIAKGEDDLASYASSAVHPMTAPEFFTPDTLYEKIDGKAEIYLSSGFRKLTARRFVSDDKADDWFEVFEYRMADMTGAFAVYSLQKREEVEKIGFARFGYRSGPALFFVHGPYYIEIISASDVPGILTAMEAWAETYVKLRTIEKNDVRGPELFPETGLDPESLTLLMTDAFGFDRLNMVFTAEYRLGDATVMAFLSHRKDDEEAQQLSEAYRQFLMANGGTDDPVPDITGAWAVNFYDAFEIVFTRGPYLAGVHMADDRNAGLRMTEELMRRLDEAAE